MPVGTRHVNYGSNMASIIRFLKLMVLISFDFLAGEYLVEVSRENLYMYFIIELCICISYCFLPFKLFCMHVGLNQLIFFQFFFNLKHS